MSQRSFLPPSYDHFNKPVDPCAGKHGGAETSVEAFERANITGDLEAALRFIRNTGEHGATAKEFAASLGKTINQVSGRFTTLKDDLKLIRPNGLKRDRCLVMVLNKR